MITKEPLVIDASYWEPVAWNRVTSWNSLDPTPKGIIARATYGVRQDTYFMRHMEVCDRFSLPRGAYHYLYATPLRSGQPAEDSIGEQADNFVKAIKSAGFTQQDTVWMDWEETGNEKAPSGLKLAKLVRQWLEHVEREAGIRPDGIYSRNDQLLRMQYLKIQAKPQVLGWVMPEWLQEYSLWLAWYPLGPYVDKFASLPSDNKRIYPTWHSREPAMWQYSDKGMISPLVMSDNHKPTTFDFNVAYPQFAERWGLNSPPPKPLRSVGELLELDSLRLQDPDLTQHVTLLKGSFPEVF